MDIPEFKTQKELFEFLHKNQSTLIAQKKAMVKEADGFLTTPFIVIPKGNKETGQDKVVKADPVYIQQIDPANDIRVKSVINTTNLFDSHKDVHLPSLWDKSLKENTGLLHIQEHRGTQFDKIIADGEDLEAYTKTFSWKELGYPQFKGQTEALMFDSLVRKDRNAYMHEQYVKGYVKNHSVGMRYVKLVLAINDEDYGAEFEAWEKYIEQVANKEDAEEYGYMWIVKEAKVIEGSAVPKGSNWITPTQSVEEVKTEPSSDTPDKINEPSSDTRKVIRKYDYLAKKINSLKI